MKRLKLVKQTIGKALKKSALYIHYSKKLTLLNKNKKQRIIVCFDGKVPHGGLVDRMKGIISFYEISKILDYDFSIVFNDPFDLTTFLEPNKVNWKTDEKEIQYSLFSTKIFYLVNYFKNPFEIVKKTKAKSIYVYSNVDYLPYLYPNKNEDQLNAIWRNNYLELFKISDYFQEKLNFSPKESRFVYHTRFTSLMGDFLDSTTLVLDESNKQILVKKVLESIEKSALLHSNNNNIYILSDSQYFLNYIKKETAFKVLDGVPKHLEDKNRDLSFHLKTFMDFYFIIQSETVFLIRIDQMYNSSFSRYASIIGNSTFKLIKD